ncbi:hypothetical protein DFH08DRAFT_678361, partial [Mycena albidolilacea]
LLHIPDNILNVGPMWCYWNYITKRFVGFIVHSNKSRKTHMRAFLFACGMLRKTLGSSQI